MLKQLGEILKAASAIMLAQQPSGIESKEGHANFVTEADKRTQEYLQRELGALLPSSTFFGEEKDNEPLTNQAAWVVDPIDGTLNYIHGLKHSAISVTLSEHRQVQLAAVYNTYRDEMFTAQKGKGAHLNGQPIQCAGTPFHHALTFYGTSPYQPGLVDTTFKSVTKLMFSTAEVRRFGSAILDLAYVACGRADIFLNSPSPPGIMRRANCWLTKQEEYLP
jgi:myo-inositol-1(or 4)-monophosphatase